MIPIKFMSKEIPDDYFSHGKFNAINITWAITRKCSLSCSYCEVCNRWKHFTPDKKVIDGILNYIYRITKDKKYVDDAITTLKFKTLAKDCIGIL